MTSPNIEYQLEQASYWNGKADDYGQAAQRMRQIAGQLRTEVSALTDLFGPIRRLHTTATWQGNAATLSRNRLDVHEDRHRFAVRAIEGIANDLDADASTADHHASQARSNERHYRQEALKIEIEMGALDNAFN